MSGQPKNPDLAGTWPLFDEGVARPFSAHPEHTLSSSAPKASELSQLEEQHQFNDRPASLHSAARTARESLPPLAPDWMRAARALSDWLEARIRSGSVDSLEQAAIARTWATWSMGGASESHVLRVAHLVGRAHSAIRETPRQQDPLSRQLAYQGCAGVLHRNLPSVIRERMPFERALLVVRQLHDEADHWVAIVDGTSELLGWKDYARVHAAAVLRSIIERSQ